MAKVYDRKLDREVGHPAEEAVLKYLHSIAEEWWSIFHWPYGKMGVDIAVVETDVWFVDVECRRNWKAGQDEFPFSTIRVPARKKQMIEDRRPFIYFSVREDLKKAALIKGDVILASEIAPAKNSETSGPDDFFHVPRKDILRYRRLDGNN